jgi:putative ATP-binding cassette transporter
VKNLRSTLAIVWRIASPYFRSEDRFAARILLAAVIALQFASVGNDVLVNQWRSRFYNALQDRDWNGFVREMIVFCVLAAIAVVVSVYQLYLMQWLQIRWRNWMTTKFLGEWLHNANYYRMELQGEAADNPDQRLSDDVRLFVERTTNLGIQLLGSIVSLASFVIILWGLSDAAPLSLFGHDIPIPGYLVWAALIYAVFGTTLTHWIGRPLVNLNFEQQRYEADFRFNLVRVRENTEQIALLKGDGVEREHLLRRFSSVIANWYGIMSRTKRLTAFTGSYGQAAVVFPIVLAIPAYFANKIQIGALLQTAEAFGKVQDALSFFVSSYSNLAEWRAIVARLDGFEMSVHSAANLPAIKPSIEIVPSGTEAIEIDRLLVRLPNGKAQISANDFTIRANEATLVTGPSGSGKSTLFRAIGGIWPFGSGAISIPAKASLMMLPQRPYFPIGTLKDAVTYPASADAFAPAQIADALTAVGLPQLIARLDENSHWNRMLSLGEQQRLGIARSLLHAPQYLFLDEATASLDEPSEARLYHLLQERLPKTTIVSIGHRSTLRDFHQRTVQIAREGDGFTLQANEAAALSQQDPGGA